MENLTINIHNIISINLFHYRNSVFKLLVNMFHLDHHFNNYSNLDIALI